MVVHPFAAFGVDRVWFFRARSDIASVAHVGDSVAAKYDEACEGDEGRDDQCGGHRGNGGVDRGGVRDNGLCDRYLLQFADVLERDLSARECPLVILDDLVEVGSEIVGQLEQPLRDVGDEVISHVGVQNHRGASAISEVVQGDEAVVRLNLDVQESSGGETN